MERRGFFARLAAITTVAVGALLGVPPCKAADYGYRAGHHCPRCGRHVLVVYSFRRDGRHWHRCGQTFWWH